eukprot:6664212-Pyramimonas_sp.AAC.1
MATPTRQLPKRPPGGAEADGAPRAAKAKGAPAREDSGRRGRHGFKSRGRVVRRRSRQWQR